MPIPRKVTYIPEVRFSDIDAMGHVNNATYLSYFEQARINFFDAILERGWDWETEGLLVARNEIDYLVPVVLNDQISIVTWCDTTGRTSFAMHYEIRRGGDGTIMTRGKAILVCFDHESNEKRLIPEIWKKLFVQS